MANPFIPSPNDAAVQLLQMVFGDVITKLVSGLTPQQAGNAAASMLGEAFRYFNSGVLVFGSFILTWVTVFGIANSANDGEVLGNKWSTFYTPLRSITAAAVLVPMSSGFAGVQVIMLLLVTMSIGFASNIWTNVANFSIAQAITDEAVRSIAQDPSFDSNLAAAIRMGACAQGVNNAITTLMPDSTARLQMQAKQTTEKSFGNTTYITTYSYASPEFPGSDGICGTFSITDSYPLVTNIGKSIFTTNSSSNTSGNGDTADFLRKGVAEARNQFLQTIFTQFVPIAVSQISYAVATATPASLSATELSNAIANQKTIFINTIKQSVTTTIQGQNADFVSKMTGQGWIFAGSYWSDLARIKDAVRSSTSTKIVYTAGSGTLESVLPQGTVLQAANGIMANMTSVTEILTRKALEIVSDKADTTTPTLPALQTNFSLNDFADGDSAAKTSFGKWTRHLGVSLIAGMINNLVTDGSDPVMQVKSLGDWIATFAEGAFIVKTALRSTLEGLVATASSSLLPGSSVAAGFAKAAAVFFAELWALVSPSLTMLLYIGYFLGIWIPMVPYYVFAIGVVGWLVFVVEMMVAGVLWAAAHTTPARDNSFIGSQMQGYMLLMSGFFRPALMIVGLVASNALLYPAVAFINASYITKVQALQQEATTGILSIAGYMLLYCVIMHSVFMLIFALPQALPDRVLRWIGAGVGDLGENQSMGKIESQAGGQARTAMIAGATKRAEMEKVRRKERDDEARRAVQESGAQAEDASRNAPALDTGPGPMRV